MKCFEAIEIALLAFLLAATVHADAIAGDKPPRLDVRFDQGRISITAVNVEIADVLREVARQANVKLTTDKRLQGRVSIRLENMTVSEALKSLSASRALVYEYDSQADVYRIIRAAIVSSGTEQGSKTAGPETTQNSNPSNAPPAGNSTASRRTLAELRKTTQVPPGNVDSRDRKLYLPGELLVRFQPNAAADAVARLHQGLGSRVLRRYERLGIERIRLRDGFSEAAALEAYAASDLVAHVELNAYRYLMEVPDDPLYGELWGLHRISASQAWDLTSSSAASVVVAVIDSGIEYHHPDLAANMWQNINEVPNNGRDDDNNGYVDDRFGYDFAEDDPHPLDSSASGHGTHVAGIIGAVGDNALGITGVAWSARIMALKVEKDGASTLDMGSILAALDYAAANGAGVINCSYGGGLYSAEEYALLKALGEQGVLAVCAAGNDGMDIDPQSNAVYPASYNLDNIISVAASNTDDELADFSNWGLTSVDLAAPGTGIKSTVPGGTTEAYVQAADISFSAVGMKFAGLTDAGGLTALLIDCGWGYPAEFPPTAAGNIALIKRGSPDGKDFYFSDKVANAQVKGAVAVIIFNNVVDNLDLSGGTLQTADNWVPTVSVSLADGLKLANRAGTGVTLVNRPLGGSDAYAFLQGTSMATPFVTGAVALGRVLKPQGGFAMLKSVILESTDRVPALAGRMVSGGRLNLYAAVRNLTDDRGDLNCNQMVDLADAIVALQVLIGNSANLCPDSRINHDVNGDQRIGYGELIYVLQRIAGRR